MRDLLYDYVTDAEQGLVGKVIQGEQWLWRTYRVR